MTRIKKAILWLLLLLLVTVTCLFFNSRVTRAETAQTDISVSSNSSEEVTPRGLYTKLGFSLDGGDGQVWFTVKNEFTLFSSKVTVIVELYRSDTYQESYQNMMLVAYKSTTDLDQGETITATSSTEGKQSYWKARGLYKRDSDDWKEKITDTLLFNANGTVVL